MTLSLSQAEKAARRIVDEWSLGVGLVGFAPGASLVLDAVDLKMVGDVAKTFAVDDYDIDEIATAVAASAASKAASDGILSFFPVFGWVAKAAISGAVTKAAGETVIQYFKARSPLK
jgi:uncharacterized protein (DUF697 family)